MVCVTDNAGWQPCLVAVPLGKEVCTYLGITFFWWPIPKIGDISDSSYFMLQYSTVFVGVTQCSGGMSLLVFPKGFICQQTELIELAPTTLLLLPAASKITSNYRWRWGWTLLKYLLMLQKLAYSFHLNLSSFTLLDSWVCLILHSKVACTVLVQCLSCIRQQKTGTGAQNCFETSAQLRPALQFL